uniref:Macro domain-containing protein n=1 Tax=Denticeps clupeoides TaxID=299321 RepID=A0AAY4ENN5_9TELE
MGAGIAVLFRNKFGGVEELKAQSETPGYRVLEVTKMKASHKPTYNSLRKSLVAMKSHCLENGVRRISMPRIGCGLDRLNWKKVSFMIEEVFQDTSIFITVYTL